MGTVMKYVKNNGVGPYTLPGGEILAAEESGYADENDPQIAAALKSGALIEGEAPEGGPSKSALDRRAKELSIEGRSSMDKEELADAIAKREAEIASGDTGADNGTEG